MTAKEALKELMDAWNSIEAFVMSQYPGTSEEIYQIVSSIMNNSILLHPRPGEASDACNKNFWGVRRRETL